jgi:spermidine/putrescine transport system ATP-binding protein
VIARGAQAGLEGPVPAFSIQGLSRRFGTVVAVDDLWLDIREGEFFSLLGPSGCGKTTTLRMLAGFEEPDTGQILLRGSDITATPPNRRNVNLVFQHYELFPHMTVFQNVAYGLKLRKVREPELSRRVRDALRIVRVEELETRGARQLSGGQQQRVALARAVVNRPAVLLLDEPLSALDVKLRKQMQLELKQIQHELGTTFVYVTHDQEEALLLSDRVGIMNHGRLAQVGTPREVYEHPADAFVADFVGSLNTFEGVVAEQHGDVVLVRARGQDDASEVPLWATTGSAPIGSKVMVAVRPERVEVHSGTLPKPAGPVDRRTALTGRVAQTIYLGSLTQLVVETDGRRRVLVERTSDPALDVLTVGSSVVVSWPPDAAFLIPVNRS